MQYERTQLLNQEIFNGVAYFRRRVTELSVEAHLCLKVTAAAAAGRREVRRGGSEESLEDGHDQEHGDENGSSDEAERNSIDRVVEVPPVLLSLHVVQRSPYWRPCVPLVFQHFLPSKFRVVFLL